MSVHIDDSPTVPLAIPLAPSLDEALNDPDGFSDRELLLALLASQKRVETVVGEVLSQARPVIESVSKKGLLGLMSGAL